MTFTFKKLFEVEFTASDNPTGYGFVPSEATIAAGNFEDAIQATRAYAMSANRKFCIIHSVRSLNKTVVIPHD